MTITLDDARRLPKVLLHDHLDGGLRVATIMELAESIGWTLPTPDPDELQAWFTRGAETADLLQYLATFEHTLAVMQTADHIERIAHEAVVDLADDGVVYAEIRFAPELHQQQGLALEAVVDAVTSGLRRGEAAAAADGRQITVNAILCAMRTEHRSVEIARLVERLRAWDDKVVAFDLAGAETGFPPSLHAEALAFARSALLNVTIHASEPPDLELISDALVHGAHRIGHGVRLRSDTNLVGPTTRRACGRPTWSAVRWLSTCSTTRSISRWRRRATCRSAPCRASPSTRSGPSCAQASTSATTPTTG
jgi:adenosine deaminase